MKLYRISLCLVPVTLIVGIALWRAAPVEGVADAASTGSPAHWSEASAAKYLDDRELWWQSWPRAQKDHGTICISCHTNVPYAMSRPALRSSLHESAVSAPEKSLLDSVEKRVGHWDEMVPFYSDAHDGPGKTAEAHSTEAVMNAVILTSYDLNNGDRREEPIRSITRAALDAAWALQLQTGEDAGGWIWQDFHLSPWESHESSYEGAAMLMLNLGTGRQTFVTTPADKHHQQLLEGYLRKNYAAQPLLNQLYAYWASAKTPELLSGDERADLQKKIEALQKPDGGWNLSSLDSRERVDKTTQPTGSDSFATAVVVLAFEANNTHRKSESLKRGLAWLEDHQQKDGRWQAFSLNKERDPESNIGKFMSDAATGYAVLALEQAR